MKLINRMLNRLFAPVERYMADYTERSWAATTQSDAGSDAHYEAVKRKLRTPPEATVLTFRPKGVTKHVTRVR